MLDGDLRRARRIGALSLFSSASTLVCCAMPALFVTLGAGATLAGLTTAFPQLIWLSRHKTELFTLATFMLTLAGYLLWRAKYAPCPSDPELAAICARQRRSNIVIYLFSVAMFGVGLTFAFILPMLNR